MHHRQGGGAVVREVPGAGADDEHAAVVDDILMRHGEGMGPAGGAHGVDPLYPIDGDLHHPDEGLAIERRAPDIDGGRPLDMTRQGFVDEDVRGHMVLDRDRHILVLVQYRRCPLVYGIEGHVEQVR